MIKIAICDDDIAFSKLLKRYLIENINDSVIDIFSNTVDLLESINCFDVLFLDYKMPYKNGIQVLEEIKRSSIIKIMVSNYEMICFDTFMYQLFWFVRKKNLNKDLKILIPHLLNEIERKEKRNFIFSDKGIHLSVEYMNIISIVKNSNYIYVHTTDNIEYKIRSSFSNIIKLIDSNLFIIPTYGIMLNISHIKYINFSQSTILLKNGRIFTISRSKKDEVKRKYAYFCSNISHNS